MAVDYLSTIQIYLPQSKEIDKHREVSHTLENLEEQPCSLSPLIYPEVYCGTLTRCSNLLK